MWSTLSALWRRLMSKLSRNSRRDEEEVAELVIVSSHPGTDALLREANRCLQGQPFDFQKKVVVVEDGVLKVTSGPI
jgi:hypothetical protein